MAKKKIVDTILPTTMVGSYPRPHWYTDQLNGRDVRVAFKNVDHAEAYEDATIVAIQDQEEAGLDIITDGQMSYDDYVGVIGSFCWYMYERIVGFEPPIEPDPANANAYSDAYARWCQVYLQVLELSERRLLKPMWWPAGADAREPVAVA